MKKRQDTPEKEFGKCNRFRGVRPKTEEKYHQAIEMYASTEISGREICRICGVTESGFRCYLTKYHRELLLARYAILCDKEEARHTKLGPLRGQLPATQIKYKAAIEACGSMEHIELNVSQIARMFGLEGTNLGRQLRTHYPDIIEWREKTREWLGISDGLQRGTRRACKEQYAEALKLLRGNSYLTVQEVAYSCGLSYTGLEQHLLFYHKDLVKKRIRIREKALRRQRKGEITGRGTVHVPSPELVEKYAEAVHLYATTPMSAARIAGKTGVSKKGFYEHLQRWHLDLVCRRKNIPYEEGRPVDWSKVRKYNPATKAKYAEAIRRLKESGLPTAQVAAEFGLQPEAFRSYLKEHEPELYARQGMVRTDTGGAVSRRSMERYSEAMQLHATTTESVASLAQRFGFNACSFGQFIRRNFPGLVEKHNEIVRKKGKQNKQPASVCRSLANHRVDTGIHHAFPVFQSRMLHNVG